MADVIPLVDLAASYAEIQEEVEPLILSRLRSGDYLGAETIAAFEREWAAYVGGGVEAVACSSGTDAVELAVRCCTDEGATVDVQERTFIATVAAVERAGRKVQRDVLNERWEYHPREERPKNEASAAILTHLYGSTCGAREKARSWRDRGAIVIEDASQAHGNKVAGTVGDAAAWSLYPSKNLGSVTQAGVVTFKDSIAAARARRMREHGYDRKHDRHFGRGWNLRMNAISADVLRVKLRHLDRWVERRRAIAGAYRLALGGPKTSAYALPAHEPDHAWHIFPLRVHAWSLRDQYVAQLRERGVMAAVHYRRDAFGNEAGWCTDEISLPVFPQMTDEQIGRVIDAVKAVIK
jgi:dTDP-4-amino-4,6-dideoxygalactose transaminase